MGSNLRKFTLPFQDDVSAIANGEVLTINRDMVTMNVSVTGDATGFTLNFEGKVNADDDYTAIMCANLTTLALSTTATANGIYQVDLTALRYFRCRLSAISSGSLSASGTAVD
jgi:hypothetical protein